MGAATSVPCGPRCDREGTSNRGARVPPVLGVDAKLTSGGKAVLELHDIRDILVVDRQRAV